MNPDKTIDIDLTVEAGEWPNETALRKQGQSAIEAAIKHVDVPFSSAMEVSLLFTDDNGMRTLNRQWRQQDKPTNVLSFAANEGGGPQTPLLGDIIVAFDTVKREAGEENKTFDHHLAHLLVHGFLHLLGYDHLNDRDAEHMETLEKNILADLGIDDPYADP